MVNDPKKFDFTESINRLEEINSWFQNEEIDLDEGLKKLKEGKDLIKKCRGRLAEVKNEFVKINDEFAEEEGAANTTNKKFSESQPFTSEMSNSDIDSGDVPF